MNRANVKRGRLRETSIRHLYDEDGAPAGHTVRAEHEPDMDDAKKADGYYPSPAPIETAHGTHEDAMAKVMEHHADNLKRFGGKKKKAMEPTEEMRKALGR